MKDYVKLSIDDISKIQNENNGFRYIDENRKKNDTGKYLQDISLYLLYDEEIKKALQQYYISLNSEIALIRSNIMVSINNEQKIIEEIERNKKINFFLKTRKDEDFSTQLDSLNEEEIRKNDLMNIYEILKVNREKVNNFIKNSNLFYWQYRQDKNLQTVFNSRKEEYLISVVNSISRGYDQLDAMIINQDGPHTENEYRKTKKIIHNLQKTITCENTTKQL